MYRFEPSHELKFTPSPHSANDYGVVPLVVAGVAAGVSLTAGAIKGAQEKKAQKEADPAGTYLYYQQKYEECKAKVEAKGKKVYPEDPRTSILVKNCHTDYKNMEKWEAQAAPYLLAAEPEEAVDKGKPGKPVGYTVPILLGTGVVATLGLGYLMFFKQPAQRRKPADQERSESK